MLNLMGSPGNRTGSAAWVVPACLESVRPLKVLEEIAALPVTLIGFSWGAWLSTILAARHPHCVGKLVLVSSGLFEEKNADGIMKTRLGRLGLEEQGEAQSLIGRIAGASGRTDEDLERFCELMSIADAYAPLPGMGDPLPSNREIYSSVWSEASKMRSSGELLRLDRYAM